MSGDFGPFTVDPSQVAGLGGALFQELVNRLLTAEVARAGFSRSVLRTSYQENVGDRGVDAGLYAAVETDWIPAGDSAWQFKAGDLGPQGCADELEGASRALEILRDGGKYRLVLGKALEDYQIDDREQKLREKATALGFDTANDRFRVLDGNQLARWVESYPQLAVSTVLGGPGNVAIGIDKWQQSNAHQSTWVSSDDRDELAAAVQDFLDDSDNLELRIEGVSGLGKTRSVLESLRHSKFAPMVLYVGDAADLSYPLIDYLSGQGRTAIVVVDECSRKRHNVLAQQLQHGGRVKLLTIGEQDARVPQTLPLGIGPLPNEVLEQILNLNRPSLWPEARRVVVANCAGNVRWAFFVADAILRDPNLNVGSLIHEETIRLLVGRLLSDGDDFLALSALALFTRYGVNREARAELESISRGLGIPIEDLLFASAKLERLGLASAHGRYRSITPQPVAVFLATRAWEMLSERILGTLLPDLEPSLAERLFLRAADLGSSGPAAVALNSILGPEGPFRSLAALSEGQSSNWLIQLAIISPGEVTRHLSDLVLTNSDHDLRGAKSIRRDLVRTLEKLVWHSFTFEAAADMLLQLALNENERWSNNANGVWIDLFGGMLPSTAARPRQRIAYLERKASDSRAEVRRLVALAADHAIDIHGTVMVSGELQGGVIVEPRGTPETYGQLWEYFRSAIGLLRRLADDDDQTVRSVSEKALIDAIHPMLENTAVRDTLFQALATLPPETVRKVRTEVHHLYALFARVETPEFLSATDSEPDVADRRAGLDVLNAQLPQPSPTDELASLAHASRWEWDEGQLEAEINRILSGLPRDRATAEVLDLLAAAEPPTASFELGAALYTLSSDDRLIAELLSTANEGNLAALAGYLHAAIRAGEDRAFDAFLDGEESAALEPAARLALTVRGPKSEAGWRRVLDLIRELPVEVAAPRLFGWHVDVEPTVLTEILSAWLPRVENQAGYNAAVDVTAMMVFKREPTNPEVEERVAALVQLRERFPKTGQQSWDWVQLARRRIATDANGLVEDLLNLLERDTLQLFDGSEEQKLIKNAIEVADVNSLPSILSLIQRGSWRLQMDFRGWLADAYPVEGVIAWVGKDIERARIVASLTGVPEEGPPTPLVRFLLNSFPADDQVASALVGDFISGSWWGNESDRLAKQIDHLDSWIREDEPPAVKDWARKLSGSLTERRVKALEREAEEDR